MEVDWTNIIVAVLAFMGSAYGSYKGKDKITALLEYRLKKLEEKQDKHNNLIVRMFELEKRCGECSTRVDEKIKVANHRIEDIENEIHDMKG